eukprot:TRINITY_DN12165_c0_g2_i1.p1 TRINITY_DN12165_c0_g2~~TRINITY_DN12165_c0_g2_i1.p1  ORF type:complete len:149 (+),score=35.39 TRINITY_DN12165_c0_g2_i1:121-567(+)
MSDLTEEDIHRFDIAFYNDEMGDGTLSVDLLREWAAGIGFNVPESTLSDLSARFNRKDIDFKDLLEILASQIKTTTKAEDLKIAFQAFDGDRSGSISRDELRDVLRKLEGRPSDEEIQALIDAADVDGDGQVRACTLFATVGCWQAFV